MKYIADTHTHTLASGHAYNTINEMAKKASEEGLEFLAITEHAPKMPGSCHEIYFINLVAVPKKLFGVEIALGAELNIMDFEGNVDLNEFVLNRLDIAIASFHGPCLRPGTKEENTKALIKCCENPHINILGHPDDSAFPIDYLEVVKAAKRTNTLLEVNNSSMSPNSYRQNAYENYITMLKLCKEYEVSVVVGSDAHFIDKVGAHDYADKVFAEVDFPQELIMNYNLEKLKEFINNKKA